MGHTLKNGSYSKKGGYICKNGSHMEKWFTLRKMDHTWKNGSHIKNVSQLEKLVTLE